MNKKVISSVLAGVMALSTLGTSVFAATTDKQIKTAGATTYKVAATLAAPEINVTIPGAVSAVVNPYGVSFEMKGVQYGAQGVTSGLYTIKNNTTASAVSVNVTPTLTVPTKSEKDSEGKTVKTPTIAVVDDGSKIGDENAKDKGEATKSIYAIIAGAVGSNTDVDKAPKDLKLFKIKEDDELAASLKSAVFEDATTDDKNAVHTTTTLLVIPKATSTTADGKVTITKYGYGQFQLGGEVTDTAKTPWTSADKININLVLDIGPCADPVTE